MLKIMTITLCYFFVFGAFASDIQISPNVPVECENYSGPIEMVFVPKIETIEKLTMVTFYGAFGACKNKSKITNRLKRFIKLNFWNEGINTPWNQFQGDVAISRVSKKVFKAEIFFNSGNLFETSSERHFTFTMLHSNNRNASKGATRKSWSLVITENSVRIY